MWIRVRLDIGWIDLLCGVVHGLFARSRERAVSDVESGWSDEGDVLACLSVRTGLDLLLQSLNLPPGSEVLYSAATIPDMPYIAREYGLVAVPVELTGADFHVDLEALKSAISPQSKVLLVAHLFGARPKMERVIETARQAGLLFVEDCAQAWCGPEYRGHPEADASFFSFGTIKTGTALGGAMLRVSRPDLLAEMRRREAEYPAQSQAAYTRQVTRTGVLKLISSRIGFGLLTWLAKLRGLGVDELLNRLTKGFPLRELFPQIRQRPCPALLRLLHRRLTKYDGRSVERRVANARLLMERSGFQPVELLEESHTFWLFPFQTDRPREFIDRLRELGIDATQYGRLEVVEAPPERPGLRCETARAMLDRTVFVPCYAGLPEAVLDKAARLMSEFQLMDTAEATASASASERQPIAK